MCPSITIDDGVHKGRGVDLAFSICFCHREDHSQIETRVRNRLYSYHLAMKSQPLPLLLTEIRTDLAQARKSGVKISWSESGSKWVNTIASRSILIGQDVAPYAPTGAKRKTLEDSNDSITLLFDFVDAVESSLKRAEEHDDTRQAHGVFQIANPGVRDAWHSAVNPTQVRSGDMRNRFSKGKAKGASKGRGKGKSKKGGKGKNVFAQFTPPRNSNVRRCPCVGCHEFLTTRRMRTVCETCFQKSLRAPVRLVTGGTFPSPKGKGYGKGAGKSTPFGKGKGFSSRPLPDARYVNSADINENGKRYRDYDLQLGGPSTTPPSPLPSTGGTGDAVHGDPYSTLC